MKDYNKPKIEIIKFAIEDITTSTGLSQLNSNGNIQNTNNGASIINI